jgi:SET domain-containing protein
MYRPLPNSITIKESTIQGLGLFATEKINAHALIGVIHYPRKESEDGHIRTPLGGFGNHSDDPNCSKILMEDGSWWISANQDIMAGEEICWAYTLYQIK